MTKTRKFFNFIIINIFILLFSGICKGSTAETKICTKFEFKCNNGECVHKLRKCDTIDDCSDKSDEVNCGSLYCDTQTHFLCDHGECISREMVCDGSLDCFDHSDERHCRDGEECPETRHKCENGRCIPLNWKCDGVEDCEGGDDERNCSNSCSDGYAPCNNGNCLPSHFFCDGNKDCEDNEDEDKCGNFTNACFTENGHFLCLDGLKCLKDELVCDDKTQCNDGSDEGAKCGMPCEDLNPPCSQACFKTPTGPRCKCKPGYKLSSNSRTCEDIDECKSDVQVCDHFCKNTEGSFRCACADNYNLLGDDNATCRIEGSAMLLFSVGYKIISKMLDGSESWVVAFTNGERPSAIAFDPKYQNVYWISDKKKIYVKSLRGREEPKVFLYYGLDDPENLALDWLGRNIYITEYNKAQIVVCNIESIDCFVLMKNLSQPRSLQLDLEERKLYFTTITSHKIMKAGMDGKSSEVLINEDIVWPNGLALDYPSKRIYWVDAKLDRIDSSDYNGRDRKGFLIKDASHAYSLAVWQDRIYWTDWEKDVKKEIHSCRKRDGMAWKSEFKNEKSDVNNIMIHHSSMFKTIYNACENFHLKCSHICLLSPNNPKGYICACPKEMKLSSDEHYCEEFRKSSFVAIQTNVYRVLLRYYTPPVTTAEKLVQFNAGNIVDMDYNPSKDEIYLADPKSEAISKVSMSDGMVTKIIGNIRFPTSIAIDWLRDNLYWINGIHHTVEVSRTNGSYRKKIANQFHSPTDIALDVIKGYIYISDGNISPTINKCELNGTYCRVVADKDIPKSTSLYVDVTTEPVRIFWTNPEVNKIESIDEHGNNRTVEIKDLSNPIKLNVDKDFIIWTEKLSDVVHFAPKHTHESTRTTKLEISEKPKGSWFMALASAYEKQNLKNPCFESDRKCHQFCFSKTSQNMVCGCSQGLTLEPDGSTCATQKCKLDEWMCENGECVTKFVRCDGSVDCADESDEKNCTDKPCSKNQFRCNDGMCIDKDYKCDNFLDCHDESDEENCPKPKTCEKNAWQCDSGECIPISWRCNAHSQCKDGSDEKNCEVVVCSKDKKKCENGNCIPLTWWCDGQKDCKTGEDEKNCPCKLGQYKCKNGQCLDERKLCRKEISCGEEALNITCPTLAPNTHKDCPLNFVSCDSSASEIKCIPYEGWCNKTIECPNKEDEKHCACDEDKLKCDGEETCIFRKWLCDNEEDCVDGSDEKGCFPLVKKDLVEEYCSLGFKCPDETCISSEKVCNGINDCADSTDESGDCDKCQHNNGGCQQICHNYPTKVKCSCKIGFILSIDGITCEDLNECENEEICHHYCENIKGSFYCTCAEGYTLKEDGFTCKPDKPHSSLVIIREKELNFFDETFQDSYSPKLVIPEHFSPETKYIYDPVDMKLIGIDGNSGIVYVESNGKWVKEMASVDDVKDVAFDYINRNIYIVRTNIIYNRPSQQYEGRKMGSTVQIYNLERKLLGELFVVPDKNITSLKLSLAYYEMFTCENDEGGVIMSRNLDGSILGTLVGDKIIYCNSLVIDEFKKRIYWIDEALNKIESVDILGTDRRRFISKQIHGPKSLSLLNHNLLWFNSDQNALVKCSIRDPNNCSELPFSKKSETFIINRDKIYDISIHTPCSSSPCHHICVPHLMEIYHCACAIGYHSKRNNCTLAIDFETGGIPGNCAASPCEFGTCIPLPFGLVSCRCENGYTGTLCDVELNLENWSSFYLALGLTLAFIAITLIVALYCYKKKLCHGFTVKKKSNIRFVSPSFVLIEEDSTSQPPTPPIPRSIKVDPKLHKQGSQDSNDSAIAIDIP